MNWILTVCAAIVVAAATTGCEPPPVAAPSGPPQPPGTASLTGAESKIVAALESKTYTGMIEVRVESIKTIMWDGFGIPVHFAPGIDINARMNLKDDPDRKLKDTLRQALEPLKLEYVVKDEALLVQPKAT